MTFTTPEQSPSQITQPIKATQPIQYSRFTIERAERALRCTSFRLPLFIAMQQQSVELKAIAGGIGLHNGYTDRAVIELAAENDLVWLIQVGLLRREVDGQGLTDSFRLTPLGHQLLERWQMRGQVSRPSWSDRFYNALNRWARFPSWMQL